MRRLIFLLLVSATLTACGNKGDLYLPDAAEASPAASADDDGAGEDDDATEPE